MRTSSRYGSIQTWGLYGGLLSALLGFLGCQAQPSRAADNFDKQWIQVEKNYPLVARAHMVRELQVLMLLANTRHAVAAVEGDPCEDGLRVGSHAVFLSREACEEGFGNQLVESLTNAQEAVAAVQGDFCGGGRRIGSKVVSLAREYCEEPTVGEPAEGETAEELPHVVVLQGFGHAAANAVICFTELGGDPTPEESDDCEP